ncbi:cytochrome c oxidase subunit II [Gottfriedia acidiceleris]|uniref:Cytochrome aa3 subunit 2 n=1 Tax=Gottfriedia acidiceleris TaxID=371036 RepID=A0ABY4JTX8_9BACI|nr:cytochrome c oxidase subunit II [Gottfriedia acidiceleris]UPM56288.1 cytochrome c oxidase subunit II [Gottfriedia acidiceleris]
MHLHKYEKIWLTFGMISLIVFLVIIGITAFRSHLQPAGGMDTVNPQTVEKTAPFNHPGVYQKDDGTYEVVLLAKTFAYAPSKLKVPIGKKVRFVVTSTDVTHSFSIVNTNVNMMVVPGQINTKEYSFKKPGNYLILCNEYCGTGHSFMQTTIEAVK